MAEVFGALEAAPGELEAMILYSNIVIFCRYDKKISRNVYIHWQIGNFFVLEKNEKKE